MWFLDVLLDAFLDCLKELPFLFAAFFLLEALEHHAEEKMNTALRKAGGFGPLVGALLGCVPQCGFSIMASDFFAGGVITMGTLLSVYLATSDEALVILLAHPEMLPQVGKLLITKILIGLIGGYIIYAIEVFYRRSHRVKEKQIKDLCENCGCHDDEPLLVEAVPQADAAAAEETDAHAEHAHDSEPAHGHGHHAPVSMKHLLKAAWKHTQEVIIFLFLFTLILGTLLELIGMENLTRLFLADSPLQPVLASLIGLIPNCAASVILTELYVDGVISFGSVIAGLCSAAGLGLVVLFRVNPNRRESVRVTLILLAISILSGIFLQVMG